MRRKRILVTGSRDWDDVPRLARWLSGAATYDGTPVPATLISGACPEGVDAIAERLAAEWGWPIERFPADWQTHGKRAGFLRNAAMVAASPDCCVAFLMPCAKDGCKRGAPGHMSHGGTMTADLAHKAGIQTTRVMNFRTVTA